MRFIRFIKSMLRFCPLTCLLIISALGFSLYSGVNIVLGKYPFVYGMEYPLFTSVMLQQKVEQKTHTDTASEKEDKDKSGQAIETANVDAVKKQHTIPTRYEKTKKTKEHSPYYNDPGKVALTTDYDYITVDPDTYYDDAVFIGDSRIEGLKNYSGLKNATFYCKEGLTVYDMMTKKIVPFGKKKISVEKALKKRQFKKIYIMIGINELGYKTTAQYAEQYAENIKSIHHLQPDAIVNIMGVMHVTSSYAKSSDVYNNVNINDKNVSVACLANGIDTFYLDMNPVFTNKEGGIKKKYTWDGVHLKAEYYSLWMDFLNAHGLSEKAWK